MGPGEAQRLAALRSLDILDTAAESDYDDITALAAAICGTPIAAVGLIDAERQWFKSQVGLTVSETSREDSFCAHAITTPGELFVIPDASTDQRFAENPLVTGDPSIRFYAGAPLVTSDGTALGSLCVIDRKPRQLTDEQYSALGTLARQVVRLIEHRVATRSLLEATREQEIAEAHGRTEAARFRRAFTLSASGMLVVTTAGCVTQSNDAFASQLGFGTDELVGRLITDISSPQDWLLDRDLARDLLAGTTQIVRREKHFFAKDGTLVPALVTSCVIPAGEDGNREFLDQVEWLQEQRRAEIQLLERQSTVDAIISVNAAGRVISWNDGATRMFGYDRERMLGRPVSTIVPERLVGAHEAGIAQLAAGRPRGLIGTAIDLPARRRDGSEFPVELSLSSWERGGNRYCTAIVRDVTAPRRTSQLTGLVQQAATVANDCEQLAEAMTRLLPALGAAGPANAVRGLSSGSDDCPIAVWPPTGSQSTLAAGAASACYAPASVVLSTAAGAGDPTAVTVVALRDGLVTLRVPILLGRQAYGVLELDGLPALGTDTELHGSLIQVGLQLGRVAERARTAAELTVRSLTDPLTGLANRQRTLELLQTEVDKVRPGSTAVVLFLDLDRFKVVNDSMGHAAGDEVLRAVAGRLATLLRERDTLARLGGDEFLVLCPGLPDDLLAESVARRLLEAFTEPFAVQGTQVYLGVSVGIVAVTSASTAETLLRHADIAMYRAKAAGGSGYAVFDTEMDTQVRRNLETRNALHEAIGRDEFVLHYQPVVHPADQRVAGLEALVRWERPGHGLVPPAEFIPLAEDTGLIVPLGRYVLREACRQMADWRSRRPDLADAYVAVNVAAAQLQNDFPTLVAEVLATTGLPPRQLTLEITEGALLQDLERTGEILSTLRGLGVKVALDDFGTGYSSLSYLRQLPVDILKIDRSFVSPFGTSPSADALIDVVLELARALNLDVVAEGVETLLQAEGLSRRHCEAVQGYYYSKPVPAMIVPDVLDLLQATAPQRLACS